MSYVTDTVCMHVLTLCACVHARTDIVCMHAHLWQHPNACIYRTLQNVIEMEGYFLESEPCLTCSQQDHPPALHKLEALKAESRFTDSTHLVRLVCAQTIHRYVVFVCWLAHTHTQTHTHTHHTHKSHRLHILVAFSVRTDDTQVCSVCVCVDECTRTSATDCTYSL
jgi:hypothetical protein